MIFLVTVIIFLACAVLAFFVLIQNPKGGGLTGSFGAMGSQVMGVKQTTDVMEKGTWSTMGIIAALCVICVMFYEKPKNIDNGNGKGKAAQQKSAPASSKPATKGK